MRYLKSSILLLLLIISFSCKKKDDTIKPSIYWENSNPTDYLLIKKTWLPDERWNGESYEFSYNSDNLVEKVKRIQWGTDNNSGTSIIWHDTTYLFFAYQNRKPMKMTIKEGSLIYDYLYEYENNLMVKTTIKTYMNTIQGYKLYIYDTKGNLIQSIDSTNKVNYKTIFEYDSHNNLSSQTTYSFFNAPKRIQKYIFSNYDNEVNWQNAINGLPIVEAFSIAGFGKHNYLSELYFDEVAMDKDSSFTRIYHYEYNDQKLPVKITGNNATVLFEYRKVK